MKNKTWAEISAKLDLGNSPKSDIWHFEKEAKRNIDRIVIGQASNTPTAGYTMGNLAMALSTSVANTIYRQLNAYLMAPYFTNVQDIAQQFNSLMTAAPGGPDIMDFSLSGIPMTQVEMSSMSGSTAATGPQNNLVGTNTDLSSDYNCFMTGYQQLWKYQLFESRFYAEYAKYIQVNSDTAMNVAGNTVNASDLKALLTELMNLLNTLEEFFRLCLCDPFVDCGNPSGSTGYNCLLSTDGNLATQKAALSGGDSGNDAVESLLLLLQNNATNNCQGQLQKIYDALESIDESGGTQALGYFFQNVDILYTSTLQNTPDWTGDPSDPEWRTNSMMAFRLFIYAFCQISQQLRENYDSYYNLINQTQVQPTSGSPVCTAQHACHIYSKWLVRVFLYATGAWDTSVPSYVTADSDQITNCAADESKCNTNSQVWHNFDFADFSVPRGTQFAPQNG